MAKNEKKPSGGKHKTPRVPIQMPMAWMKLARQLASGQKQPTLWFLIALLIEEAKKQGKDHPVPPWEEE